MRTTTRSNATQLSRIQLSAPGIAARRLTALNNASPLAAAQMWSSWTFEKWMTFNAAAANVAVATTHFLWAPWWLRGSASHRRDANVVGQALAPITKQIQRNRRRKSAKAY
jgi:hypothetical protein